MTKRRKLRVDIEDIVLAMSAPRDPIIEMAHYLDVDTGLVLLVSSECEDEDHDIDEIENNPQRFAPVPAFEAHDDYELMVAFAGSVDEDDIRDRLDGALGGKGSFARFRDAISPYPDLNDRWHATLHASQVEQAVAWLHEIDIEPEYELRQMPPTPTAPQQTPQQTAAGRSGGKAGKEGAPATIGLLELLFLGDGRTELLSDQVRRDITLPRRADARRVFKTVTRDICAFHGEGWRKRFITGKSHFQMGDLRVELRDDRIELSLVVSREIKDAFGRAERT